MALLGQASGDFRESSSALRILHDGIHNTISVLTPDAFTQNNPPIVTVAATVSDQVEVAVRGVLSGSVAFSRPDQGSNLIGGPAEPGTPDATQVRPLGVFINNSLGNAFENQPGPASGKGPYMSGQGTYGNALFEDKALDASGAIAQGDALVYSAGMELVASRNGYLMPRSTAQTGALISLDTATIAAQVANGAAASDTIGVLKMAPDSTLTELVYDQRI